MITLSYLDAGIGTPPLYGDWSICHLIRVIRASQEGRTWQKRIAPLRRRRGARRWRRRERSGSGNRELYFGDVFRWVFKLARVSEEKLAVISGNLVAIIFGPGH